MQHNDFLPIQKNWREILTLILDNPYNKGRSIKKGSAGRALSVFRSSLCLLGLGFLRYLLSFKLSALAAPLRRSCSALMLAVLAASVAAAQLFPPEDATANSADGGEVVDTSDEHNHNVILRVVRVTPDWHGYTIRGGGGWPADVVVKESEALKYFEVAIWEETKSIHLYEFDNDFDPYSGSSTPEQATAHRESYAIERVPGLPAAGSADTRSLFIKQAFAGFTSYIVSRYPDSEHHLIYSGHGGPGGLLFAAQLLYQDANDMLAHWTYRLGRPLGVVDMGGPCSKSSFSDLENFCQYTRYYISSDLPNGGYSFDDWTIEKHHEVEPESQYHRLFAETSNIKDALIGRINLKRKAYEYSRNNMIASRKAQANYLYSCSDFFDFSKNFRAFLHETSAQYSILEDLYNYMVRNQASHTLIENFSDVIVHRADNKDFFQWEESRNGMLMPSRCTSTTTGLPRIPADGHRARHRIPRHKPHLAQRAHLRLRPRLGPAGNARHRPRSEPRRPGCRQPGRYLPGDRRQARPAVRSDSGARSTPRFRTTWPRERRR